MDYDLTRLLLASIGLLVRVIVEQSTASTMFARWVNHVSAGDYSLATKVGTGYWVFYLSGWVMFGSAIILSVWPDRAELGTTFLWILTVFSIVVIVGNSTILAVNAARGLEIPAVLMVIFQYIGGYVVISFLLAMNAQSDWEKVAYAMGPTAAVAGVVQAWYYAADMEWGWQFVAMIFRVGAETGLLLVVAHDKK